MKRIILLLIVVFSCAELSAQKCKYDFDKKDKFSGGRLTGYDYNVKSGISTKVKLAIYLKGKKMVAEVTYVYGGELNGIITAGHKVNVRLEDEEVISLSSIGNSLPKTDIHVTSASASAITTYTILYEVDKQFLEKLATKMPLVVQVEVSDTQSFVDEIKEKNAVKMMEDMKCLLELYPK